MSSKKITDIKCNEKKTQGNEKHRKIIQNICFQSFNDMRTKCQLPIEGGKLEGSLF